MIAWLAKASTLELIIWSVFVGASISVFAVFYTRRILGSVVRRLIENGCNSPENAMTLDEIGSRKNILAKFSIKNGILRSVVSLAPRREGDSEKRYYIDESKRIRSELRFSGKDTDVFGIIIALVLFFATAAALNMLIPYMISLLEGIF